MTWIVGTVPPFGYSILASDIRVRWPDGTEKDCLQKIYSMGENFMGGFAGSVLIGFTTLGMIAEQLPSKRRNSPSDLAQKWIPKLVRRVFRSAPRDEQRLGCQIVVAAAHPTQTLGDVPWPRTYVWTFSCPEFRPCEAKFGEVLGIGCGSVVPSYKEALRNACNPSFFFQSAPAGQEILASVVARAMHKAVTHTPVGGVSPFIQIGLLTRGQAVVLNPNFREFHADGRKIEIQVPTVATSFEEFRKYCQHGALNASGVVC
jgi:hypothetical protein